MIKLASINIEKSKHLDRVSAFLKAQNPDIICLQEIEEDSVPVLETAFGNPLYWQPMSIHQGKKWGLAMGWQQSKLIAKTPIKNYYYGGQENVLPTLKILSPGTPDATSVNRILQSACLQFGDASLNIANTHCTWTPNGESNALQLGDIEKMMRGMNMDEPTVLVGDFNAPRGNKSWSLIASFLKDNIPEHYTSSIDPVLHRAAPLDFVVDGFFTTEKVIATNVQLHQGVSDHCAVTGEIELV